MDKIIVGIPRALIYYRYERLWNSFFTELGVNVKISENTTMQLFERGAQLATDETCLSYKLFWLMLNRYLENAIIYYSLE